MVRVCVCIVGCLCLLMGGCHMGNRSTVKDTAVIHRGEKLQCYELVLVEPLGSVVFRNADMGADGPMTTVRVGRQLGLRVESRRGRITEYRFTVLSSDPQKQEATLLSEIEAKE